MGRAIIGGARTRRASFSGFFELKEGFWNSKDKLLAQIKPKETILQRGSNFQIFGTPYHVPQSITCMANRSSTSTSTSPLPSHTITTKPMA
jgi:hypothetical protein